VAPVTDNSGCVRSALLLQAKQPLLRARLQQFQAESRAASVLPMRPGQPEPRVALSS
jgi:hypothetical protein